MGIGHVVGCCGGVVEVVLACDTVGRNKLGGCGKASCGDRFKLVAGVDWGVRGLGICGTGLGDGVRHA